MSLFIPSNFIKKYESGGYILGGVAFNVSEDVYIYETTITSYQTGSLFTQFNWIFGGPGLVDGPYHQQSPNSCLFSIQSPNIVPIKVRYGISLNKNVSNGRIDIAVIPCDQTYAHNANLAVSCNGVDGYGLGQARDFQPYTIGTETIWWSGYYGSIEYNGFVNSALEKNIIIGQTGNPQFPSTGYDAVIAALCYMSLTIPSAQLIDTIDLSPVKIPKLSEQLQPVTYANDTEHNIDLSIFNFTWYELTPTGSEYVEVDNYTVKEHYKYYLDVILAIPTDYQSSYDFDTSGNVYLSSILLDNTNTDDIKWIIPQNVDDALHLEIYFNLIEESTDPYEEGGTSEIGGGGGNFDSESDNVPFPANINTAYIGSTHGGIATIFAPTISEFTNFSNYLWSNTIWSVVQGLVGENAIDILSQRIISHHLIPLNVNTGGTKSVNVGWIPTDISMTTVSEEYQWKDMGSIAISEFWKGYMDYNPYTRIQLFLPFVGFVDLNTDEVMNNTIGVKYYIAVSTGDFNCMVRIYNPATGDGYVAYSYAGNCAMRLPTTGSDVTYLRDAISLIGSIGTGVARGTIGGGFSGGFGKNQAAKAKLAQNNFAIDTGASTVDSLAGQKEYPKSTGTISMNHGFLGEKTPYVVIQRPRQLVPDKQHKYTGYPSFVTMVLGNCTGFTVVEDINLHSMSCTQEESDEIISLLKSGVII